MRAIQTVFFVALVVVFLSIAPASAESLNGAEFKKIVIGNTLQLQFWSNRRGREFNYRYYFIDEKTLHKTSAGSSWPADETWSVTDEGKFCRVSARNGRTICYHDFQVKGDKLNAKTRRGRTREFKLLKGKHVYRRLSIMP